MSGLIAEDRHNAGSRRSGTLSATLVLKNVAERLKRTAREQDTVARLAGDEFPIVLTDVKDIPDAAVSAERLMDAMTSEFAVQGHLLSISCRLASYQGNPVPPIRKQGKMQRTMRTS
jgi:diguanylate cyclase (GGDEF)-like protein